MSNSQIKPSDESAIIGVISPVSQGVGSAVTGWIDISNFNAFQSLVSVGVLGTAATVDAKIQQANTSAGGAAKDITGKAITQLVKATDDGKIGLIDVFASELDINNGFRWIQLSITVAAAASLVSCTVRGVHSRYNPASDANIAAVKSII